MTIDMDPKTLLIYAIIGIVSGWLASMFIKGKDMGIIGYLIVGIIGAFVGGWIFDLLNINLRIHPWADRIIISTAGATLVLWLYQLISKKKN